MNHSTRFITAALLALTLAACTDQAEAPAFRAGKTYTISTASEQGPNRVRINSEEGETVGLVWEEGDSISQLMKVREGATPAPYALIEGAGTNNATFRGRASFTGTDYFALYPASTSYGYAGVGGSIDIDITKVTGIEIPQLQTYREGCFDRKAMPMIGNGSGENFRIKGLGAVLAFRLYSPNGESVESVDVTAGQNSDAPVGGIYTYDTNTGALTQTSNAGRDGVKYKLNQALPTSAADAITCYVVLAPGTYDNIALTICDTEGYFLYDKVFNGSITLQANEVKHIRPSETADAYDIDGWPPYEED